MASVIQQTSRSGRPKWNPPTPRQAGKRVSRIDRLLDPGYFKALSDPTRVRLLACLIKCGRPCSVTEIAECCSIDFSMVARHLATLARAGVIASEKKGRTMWYDARNAELASAFRAVAGAIEEWAGPDRPDAACGCRQKKDRCDA